MLDPTPRSSLIFLVRCCSLSHSLYLRWAGKGKAYCEMLQLYIKKIEYRVRASIFLSHSFAIARLLSRLGPGSRTLLSNLLQTRLLAPSPLFFSLKKSSSLQRWWGLTVRITFLFILLHRQDLILRRILGCSGKRGRSKDHLFDDVDTASDKRNAEEYARSSPRS